MSDSEFESIVVSTNKAGGAKQKKTGQKRKSDDFRSDSEHELRETPAQTKVKKSAKPTSSRTAASKKKTNCEPSDVFQLFPEDASLIKTAVADQLGSSITQRVADGLTRRALNLEGAFFVDLRVYNTEDIRSELPEDRWKKALLFVKAQVDTDTPQFDYLQKFTKQLKTLFDDADVKYFHNKKA